MDKANDVDQQPKRRDHSRVVNKHINDIPLMLTIAKRYMSILTHVARTLVYALLLSQEDQWSQAR